MKKLEVGVLLLAVLALVLFGCGKKEESAESKKKPPLKTSQRPPSAGEEAEKQPQALTIRYGYDGQFGSYDIADTAEALAGPFLLARAKALKIIEKEPGPNHLLVEEVHYSPEGQEAYRGTLEFRFGLGGGSIVEEKAISGKKRFQVFTGWPAGR